MPACAVQSSVLIPHEAGSARSTLAWPPIRQNRRMFPAADQDTARQVQESTRRGSVQLATGKARRICRRLIEAPRRSAPLAGWRCPAALQLPWYIKGHFVFSPSARAFTDNVNLDARDRVKIGDWAATGGSNGPATATTRALGPGERRPCSGRPW